MQTEDMPAMQRLATPNACQCWQMCIDRRTVAGVCDDYQSVRRRRKSNRKMPIKMRMQHAAVGRSEVDDYHYGQACRKQATSWRRL